MNDLPTGKLRPVSLSDSVREELISLIVAGAPEIPGATALDKMNHINTVDDSLRRFVTFEPRARRRDGSLASTRRTPSASTGPSRASGSSPSA